MNAAEWIAEHNRNAEVEMLKEELSRNEETISSLRARNIDITIRLIAFEWGISIGDVVRTPDGTQYIVKVIFIKERRNDVKPWIIVNPHTKDGWGWDTTKDINLYGRWEKVS